MKFWIMTLAMLLGAIVGPAQAHKPSDSYLTLSVEGDRIDGQWDIALRDLDFALGLDANQDDAITWGEVKARHADIAAYALTRLRLGGVNAPCPAQLIEQLIDEHSDGAYAVLRFTAACAAAPKALAVGYRLFFDLDPQHRGLIRLEHEGKTRAGIFTADTPEQSFTLTEFSKWQQFVDYGKEGIWHIWTGFDHVLFLLSLLLPAVLVRRDGRWQPKDSFRGAFIEVAKVVTAFTLAHSITLSLAALGVVSLPSRWVESAIALSVVLAALNNLFPVVSHGRWMAAFAFGLLHGFGFAGALRDLGLPSSSLALSLAGFNVGVELGQLAIVAAFLPVAFWLRRTWSYRRLVLAGGSTAIAAIAVVWFAERALDVPLFAALAATP